MPDIGLGEIIVIVVIALLVFGPDRLPRMAADAARMLRQVRQMAASARKDLKDAAGLDGDAGMAQTMRDLRDLDPRRAMRGVLSDDPTPSGPATAGRPRPSALGSRIRRSGGRRARPLPELVLHPGSDRARVRVPVPSLRARPSWLPAQADPDWT